MKPTRWVIGLVIILLMLWGVLFYPFESMLGWQSPFIMRCFVILILAALMCLYRILRGPTSADRAVGIDILGILVVGFCGLLGVATGRNWYIDIGIAWALQSFIATLALAKHLEGKTFDV